MSTLLGVLSLTGRGGSQLFVYDDSLVRAATGVGLAMSLLTDREPGAAAPLGEVVAKGLSADLGRYAGMTPEQIATDSPGNSGVWVRHVGSATLASGRWPAKGLRRLRLVLHSGETRTYEWPGNGATRPLNQDGYAVPLLSQALGATLQVEPALVR